MGINGVVGSDKRLKLIFFHQASSPACTELETITMNWLGKMIGLPDEFINTKTGKGGGVIQTTASEATLVCLLAGRTKAIKKFHEHTAGFQDAEINARLVAYCSDQAHSSVEKAALIGLVRMRFIEADENLSLRGMALQEAIEEDIKNGLIPFWVSLFETLAITLRKLLPNDQQVELYEVENCIDWFSLRLRKKFDNFSHNLRVVLFQSITCGHFRYQMNPVNWENPETVDDG